MPNAENNSIDDTSWYDEPGSAEQKLSATLPTRPARAQISPFCFQSRDVYDLARAFEYVQEAVEAVVAATRTLERNQEEHRIVMQQSTQAFEAMYINAERGFVAQMSAALDPGVPGSMPRKLRSFAVVLKDSVVAQVVKAGNEQISKVRGAEDKLAKLLVTLDRLAGDIEIREAKVQERETKVAAAETKIEASRIEAIRVANFPHPKPKLAAPKSWWTRLAERLS